MNLAGVTWKFRISANKLKKVAESAIAREKQKAAVGREVPSEMTDPEINQLILNLSASFPKVRRIDLWGRRFIMCYPFS